MSAVGRIIDMPNACPEWQARILGLRCRESKEACPIEGLVRWRSTSSRMTLRNETVHERYGAMLAQPLQDECRSYGPYCSPFDSHLRPPKRETYLALRARCIDQVSVESLRSTPLRAYQGIAPASSRAHRMTVQSDHMLRTNPFPGAQTWVESTG